jgi:hypothetical protein
LNTLSCVKYASSLHRILCKKSSPQCVDVVSIRKITSLEDDRLEGGVGSSRGGVDAIDCHNVRRGLSVGLVSVTVRYRMSFFTALVPQLQLWHLRWLVSVDSMGAPHSRVP